MTIVEALEKLNDSMQMESARPRHGFSGLSMDPATLRARKKLVKKRATVGFALAKARKLHAKAHRQAKAQKKAESKALKVQRQARDLARNLKDQAIRAESAAISAVRRSEAKKRAAPWEQKPIPQSEMRELSPAGHPRLVKVESVKDM
jgi:hypothetical protein